MSKMQVKKGNALAAAFKGKSSGEEKFGFGFIANPELNPEDIANELIAEAENAEKMLQRRMMFPRPRRRRRKRRRRQRRRCPAKLRIV